MESLEIAAMELEKVFAMRTADSGSPELALCTTGTEWLVFDPTQRYYKNTRNPALQRMHRDWRTEPLFLRPAEVADVQACSRFACVHSKTGTKWERRRDMHGKMCEMGVGEWGGKWMWRSEAVM